METSHKTDKPVTKYTTEDSQAAVRLAKEASAYDDSMAAESVRVKTNRRRAVAGSLALVGVVGLGYAGKAVVNALETHMGAEQAKKCVVINEPLRNRLLTDIARENAATLGLNAKNDGQMTALANAIQDNGGEGILPLAEATGMSPTQQVEVKVCVTDPTAIPVHIYSTDGMPK